MKKIKLVGYLGDKNLGDQILSDSAEYLINIQNKDNIVLSKLDLKEYFKASLLERTLNKIGINSEPRVIVAKKIRALTRDDFTDIDAIVFAGGGMIKYYAQDCWKHVSVIIGIAEELNIPVYLHAVGVEGYDDKDKRCQVLKEFLNKDIVKKISTRDDLETLNEQYINTDVVTELVADSAVYCDRVYDIKRSKSDIIGIGLVRGGIFKEHGKNFSKENVVELYSQLILSLKERNIKYELFTNGLSYDTELLEEICSKTGLSLQVIVPNNAKELVSIISSFKAVVAARLHACIISYSLNVPVVGLVWNDKLTMFGENIGYPNRFIQPESFSPKNILDTLKESITVGYNRDNKLAYIETVELSMKKTVDDIVSRV